MELYCVGNANKIAFAFPGQGSQYVGMGKEFLKEGEPFYQRAKKVLGFDIKELIFYGPQEELNLTENAQPAILLDSVIKYHILKIKPATLLGHSLGEYSALVCAEVLSLEEGLLLTKKRGKYMQEAVPAGVGAMAAIMKLGFEQVEEICAKAGAEAVNYNSPDQVVISGKRERVKEATKMALKLGAIVKELRVSGPFHSSLMKEAEERLKEDIKKVRFAKPLFPVVSTVSGEPEDDPQRIKELLTHQITAKVRWVDYIMKLKDLGISKIVEVGPGNVLTKLGKRITSQIKHLTFSEVVK